MASTIKVVRPHEQEAKPAGQTKGMIRKEGIFQLSDKLCSSAMQAAPHTASDVHHHGPQDTILFAVSGNGSLIYGPNGSERVDLEPGDFALIPAFVEHQEVNESDGEINWVVVRSGGEPVVCNLGGWTKKE